ncbi:peptide MFS transporter [Xenorhabdus bovienii]|uniref:Peptide MFS transporter n=1 Tax=Xenorhabdus bovienii TaxID=40576 RepID=A0AAJ1MZ57_XENBV|nr:peptide MFS transporter [Xenorhabdus bovienii]MDE1474834.1 peptide MFS transporter [Xenorhabdus bovienii]MDE1478435.1 peptide MFS transporter [Xenorhabdus bovienii]MDE1482773.1 peptide MFS transporter [Xenorhabdus bovienii]MDE1490222.1 peptide MFS transporter [Xenorhabdus bovienii]MDE9464500.1 peptide MFS transporter [Xenorhabdus bovienii]
MQPSNKNGNHRSFFGHPYPLSALFMTEMWERFSFYGIRPLLILFMSAAIFEGGMGIPREQASAIVGIFAGSIYLTSLPGGWLADNWLGQRLAVWYGSIIIALGHLSIALSAIWSNNLFFIGLLLITIGTGLFKTCVTVMVGTLYKKDDPRRDGGFSLFYMGINLGSLIAALITGWLVKDYGWHWGFGVGGLGMLVALLIFRFYTIPLMRRYDKEAGLDSSWDHPMVKRKNVGKWIGALLVVICAIVATVAMGVIPFHPVMVANVLVYIISLSVILYFAYLFLFAGLDRNEKTRLFICFILLVSAALFWSAFEQKPTSFNLFAKDYTDRIVLGYEIPAVWFQSINPLYIILLAPLFSWLWPMLAKRNMNPSSIGKFMIAMLFAAGGFGIMMFASQYVLATGGTVSPLWLIFSILLLTLGELCLSPIGLATMTVLAPSRMRGQVMGLWFCASALGNLAAGLIGGNVRADKLDSLPELFSNVSLSLIICSAVLLVLIIPIRRLMSNLHQAETKS